MKKRRSPYFSQVLASLGKAGVLLPVLAQFLVKEATRRSQNKVLRKTIEQKNAILTIRAMRQRHAQFNHGVETDKFLFHPSALGQCLRKLWFEHFNAPQDAASRDDALVTYMTFELGTAIHVVIQNLCERAGILLRREFQLQSDAAEIIGTCDGIVKIDGVRYVLEIKSINSNQWVKVQNGPKFDHKQQAMAYMFALNIPWAIILYFNKDRSSFREHVIEFDEAFFKEYVADRVQKYKGSIQKRKMPAREGESPGYFPCSFCQFATLCYSGDRVADFQRSVLKVRTHENKT